MTQHQALEVTSDERTFAEHVCAAIYHALVADFGSMHMWVDRLDSMPDPQSSLLFFKPLDGPDGGLRYATVCGQSVSQAVNDAIRSWHEQAGQAPDATTRTIQPLSLTVDEETVTQVAAAIRFAINPLDGDPIGVMVHNYEFLHADGIEAQIALVDDVCAVMARAALDRLQSLSLPVDIDRSGLAQEVDDISYAGVGP